MDCSLRRPAIWQMFLSVLAQYHKRVTSKARLITVRRMVTGSKIP